MRPAGRWCRLAGLGISALVHVAVVAAVLSADEATSTYAGDRHPVTISLAMLATDSQSESAADAGPDPGQSSEPELDQRPEPARGREQKIDPEPDPEPESEPEPDPEPTLEQEPLPPREPDQEPAPKPKPALEPAPRPEPAQARPSKPTPKARVESKRAAKKNPEPVQETRPPPRNAARDDSEGSGKATPNNSKGSSSGNDKKSRAQRDALEKKYLAGLRSAIAKKRRYPTSARRSGKTGVATVYFVLDQKGRIGSMRLDKSSGSPVLDQAAVETLQRLARYKPIPEAIGRTSWQLRVPIRFALE